MYVCQCAGGYAVPIKTGKFKVKGIAASGVDTTSTIRLTVVDSGLFKILPDTSDHKPVLIDLQGTSMVGVVFDEPIVVRNGVCVTNANNVNPGKVTLLVC